ncbi:hypothetical protein BKA93DRAFT_355345 [Sparassis latifolia]
MPHDEMTGCFCSWSRRSTSMHRFSSAKLSKFCHGGNVWMAFIQQLLSTALQLPRDWITREACVIPLGRCRPPSRMLALQSEVCAVWSSKMDDNGATHRCDRIMSVDGPNISSDVTHTDDVKHAKTRSRRALFGSVWCAFAILDALDSGEPPLCLERLGHACKRRGHGCAYAAVVICGIQAQMELVTLSARLLEAPCQLRWHALGVCLGAVGETMSTDVGKTLLVSRERCARLATHGCVKLST